MVIFMNFSDILFLVIFLREAMGEDPNAKKKEDKEEQSKSRKQIEESRQVGVHRRSYTVHLCHLCKHFFSPDVHPCIQGTHKC